MIRNLKYLISNGIKLSKHTKYLIIFLFVFFFVMGLFVSYDTVDIYQTLVLALLTGLIGALNIYILIAILKTNSAIIKKINLVENELQASIAINKIVDFPINLGDWAITARFLERLAKEIYLLKPDLILECGSGTSTLISAACLKRIGKGKVISLDHDSEFANQTKKMLRTEGLNDYAEIMICPLTSVNIKGREYLWYDFKPNETLSENIDLLIVDGPPGNIQKLSRYPALPLLKDHLSKEYVVMLDDTNRPDERKISSKWEKEFNLASSRVSGNHGFDLLGNRKHQL